MAKRIHLTEGQFARLVEDLMVANQRKYLKFRKAVDWAKECILWREAPPQSLQNFYYRQGYDYKYSFEGLVKSVNTRFSKESLDFARKAAARALKELDDENKLHDFRK